jgi:peptidyl-prolyl cis-trans isomerase SurA
VEVIAPRIEEILLQQRVNVLLRDWLKSLRDQGSVQILDAAYGVETNDDDDSGGSE